MGFEVVPRRIVQAWRGGSTTCDELAVLNELNEPPVPFDLDMHDMVIYTYDVRWAEWPIRWASRWALASSLLRNA